MPIYQVVTAGVDLDQDQRERLAAGITKIHHDETQAPEPFIRVAFQPMPLGLMYTAGRIEPSLVLNGGIREGRSEVTRHNIMRRCYELIVAVTDLPPTQIVVVANSLPSSWLLEAGLVMPEPTPEAEAAWIAELKDTYPGHFDNFG